MPLVTVLLGVLLLLFLITIVRMHAFISFILVCLFVGLLQGLDFISIIEAVKRGIGDTMGSLILILGLGAMLGKMVAESGAARQITFSLVDLFGQKKVQLALMFTGFIVGIPMFYTVGFVILVPLVFA
ncbi:MAG: GntP family permease, partial [Cyclobacteriaceae bacterium]|nr:GntP family permease [Cyclobacteriaceae bacterium]